jgi:16S rRNA (guanine527-N7)-methyltransferase
MFHVKHAQLTEVLEWIGVPAPDSLFEGLERFAGWLAEEGAAAGGIGPQELEHLWERHVLDSLMFSRGSQHPRRILDLGSGVGLPGIPLALLHPDAEVVLVDRSGRRVRLARRASRVCGAENVTVIESDFLHEGGEPADLVVMRASLPIVDAIPVLEGRRAHGGVAVVGVGLDAPEELTGLTRFPGSAILDPGRWLHIMR